MISLSASADYGLSGQYIAHITGRHPQYTFSRDFIGRKGGKRNEVSEADVDEPGLYECCDIGRKHGKKSRFYLVLEIDGGLRKFQSDKEDAMTIARALDAGSPFHEIVVGSVADPEDYEILSKKEAEKKQAAANIQTAADQCWAIMQALPVKDAKKVLAELKNKVTPPREKGDATEPTA